VQFGVFFLLAGWGEQVANLVGVVVSSVLANEVHRRLTFRAGARVSWLAAQGEGGALSVAALAASSLALALLGDVVSDDWWARVLLIASVNAVVGLVRFLLLREWVFTPDRPPVRFAGGPGCARVTPARFSGPRHPERRRVTRRHTVAPRETCRQSTLTGAMKVALPSRYDAAFTHLPCR
jgi:putative flippase GtrA